jgi:hypothetical protein
MRFPSARGINAVPPRSTRFRVSAPQKRGNEMNTNSKVHLHTEGAEFPATASEIFKIQTKVT